MGYQQERRHHRFEFQQFPWALALRLGEPSWADKPTRIEGRNVSQGGIKLLSNRRFQLFESLQISLFEKSTGKSLVTLAGKVVRVEEIDTGYGERTFGIALQFLSNTAALGTLLPPNPHMGGGSPPPHGTVRQP